MVIDPRKRLPLTMGFSASALNYTGRYDCTSDSRLNDSSMEGPRQGIDAVK